MQHIHINERDNDFWSQLGKGVGMVGGLMLRRRDDRGAMKIMQDQLNQRKLEDIDEQNNLLGAFASNEALGDDADATQRGLLMAKLANAGIDGVTKDNYQDFQKGLLARQEYLQGWDPSKTFAERQAMGGYNGFLRNMPKLI